MGVLGLTPFLKKTCPQVIKQLPDRLRSFAGKTIAIDGTLITHRLHFSRNPHPYRHVLGWYNIVRELNECDIKIICVFDGKQRNAAKAREAERRAKIQRLALARGSLESDRLARLRKLGTLLTQIKILADSERQQVFDLLKSSPAQAENIQRSSPTIDISKDAHPRQEKSSKLEAETDVSENQFRVQDNPHTNKERDSVAQEPLISIPSSVKQLYIDYQDSIPRIASLADSQSIDIEPSSAHAEVEAEAEIIMTKGQLQLTADEGKFWLQLSSSVDPLLNLDTLVDLTTKSSHMSESYARRTNTPKAETYGEAKDILKAMGVPCVEVQGAFEAEALASSLVRNGSADYVASEDTDVLMFDVPLIRNLTSRQQPLTVVSGIEIRESLELDRSSFIDFALLLGTDFSQRIKNVGPMRALKFIRQHKTIEQILELETKYPPRVSTEAYMRQVAAGRLVFENLPPMPNSDSLVPKEFDEELVSLLLQRFGLEREANLGWDYEHALEGNYFDDSPDASNIDID